MRINPAIIAALILQGAAIGTVLTIPLHVARADEKLVLVDKIDVGGNGLGAFDISYIDPKRDLYVLADRTNASVDFVNVSDLTFTGRVDTFTGVVLNANGTANNSKSGPDGVVIVSHKEVWAGDGDSTVKVIDLASRSIVKTIPTGTPDQLRVDEMAYDPTDHIIAMANNAAQPPFVTMIDTKSHDIIGKIVFDGSNGTPNATLTGIEQPQYSGQTGLFYVSVPQIVPGTDAASTSRGGVAVIDPIQNKVIATYEVDNCSPTGLALGPNNQAMVGCGGAFGTAPNVITQTALISLTDGHLIKNIPIGGADEVWYDAGTKHYYIPARNNMNPDGTANPVLGAVDFKSLELDRTVPISTTSHSIAVDPYSHAIFIPTGFVPPNSKPETDPTNPCPKHGCIAVYLPIGLDADDGGRLARH